MTPPKHKFSTITIVACVTLLTACSKPPVAIPPPALPPNITLSDTKGAALSAGSILEGSAVEVSGDLKIQGSMQILNTGGPVPGPLRSGWRLPQTVVPWQSLAPTKLPAGGEFASEVESLYLDGQEGLEAMAPGNARRIPFQCDLEPGQWLPAEIAAEYYIRRAQDSTDVFHLRVRLHPQWLLGYEPEGSPPGPTLVERALVQGGPGRRNDVDWTHRVKFANHSRTLLSDLVVYHYLKARKPFDEASAALPLVATEAATDPANWPAANPPPGFTAVQAWPLGQYLVQPHETTIDWNVSFHLGRGAFVPPGRHDIAVEIHSHAAVVHRSFYTVEVPGKLPFPNLELLGDDGRPLPPGARLAAVIDQRWKNEPPPHPVFPRDVTVTFPVHILADGIRPEDTLPDVPNDLTWMFLVGDRLHPLPRAVGNAEVFRIEGLPYRVQLDNGNLTALSDGKPRTIDLEFPLDPALAHAKAGKPGLWIDPGIRQLRLLAFPAGHRAEIIQQILQGQRPARDLILFERDFELEVQQPEPIELPPPQ